MSIASEITRIKGKVADSFAACEAKGATIPESEEIANLPTCIDSIPAGEGGVTPLGEKSFAFADTVSAGDKIYAHAVDVDMTTFTGTVAYDNAWNGNVIYYFNGSTYVFSSGGSGTIWFYVYKVVDGALTLISSVSRTAGMLRSIIDINGHLYFMLGSNSTNYHNLIIYEVTDSAITQKISFTPSYSGKMAVSGKMLNFDGDLYVLSSYTSYAMNLVKVDTSAWTTGTEYRTPTYSTSTGTSYAGYITLDGNLYLSIGSYTAGQLHFIKFNPTAETPMQSLPAVDIAPTHGCNYTAFSITDGSLFCIAANNYDCSLYKIENDNAIYKDTTFSTSYIPIVFDDALNIGLIINKSLIVIKNEKFLVLPTSGEVKYDDTDFGVVDLHSRKIGNALFRSISSKAVTQQNVIFGKAKSGSDIASYCGVAKTDVTAGATGVMTVYYAGGGAL